MWTGCYGNRKSDIRSSSCHISSYIGECKKLVTLIVVVEVVVVVVVIEQAGAAAEAVATATAAEK